MNEKGSSVNPIKRLAPTFCFAAAAIIITQQLFNMWLGLERGSESSASPLHSVVYLLAFVGFGFLLLALGGLYEHQSRSLGRLGVFGFLIAFLGTLLAAGDWWFESFAVPQIAQLAPQIMKDAPSGSLLAGGVATFLTFGIGWVVFAVATLRAGVFPRHISILLIVGGALGVNGGTPLFQIPLAIAIGWMGYLMLRTARGSYAGAAGVA